MKSFLIISILLVLSVFSIFSQDKIYLNDGRIIKCDITKADSSNVYFDYKRKSTYIDRKNVLTLVYDSCSDVFCKSNIIFSAQVGISFNLVKNFENDYAFNISLANELKRHWFIGGDIIYNYKSDQNYIFSLGPNLSFIGSGATVAPIISMGLMFGKLKNEEFSTYNFKNNLGYESPNFKLKEINEKLFEFNYSIGLLNIPINKHYGIIAKTMHRLLYSDSNKFTHYLQFSLGITYM